MPMAEFHVHEDQLDEESEFYQEKIENLAQAEEAFGRQESETSPGPAKLTLQTNYSCNLRCITCPIERPTRIAGSMPYEMFDRISRETFGKLVLLTTTTVGEPLMLPWFDRMCQRANEYGVLMDIVTNATLLDREKAREILGTAADIKVSYDGASEETFEGIRKGSSKRKVDENLDLLMKERELMRPSNRPSVTIQTTLLRSNIAELPAITEKVCSMGADRIKAYYMISYRKETDGEVLAGDDSDYYLYIEEAAEIAKGYGVLFLGAEKSEAGGPAPEKGLCATPWYQTWVDMDGSVMPCHSHRGAVMGRAENGIGAVWNGAAYRDLRSSMISDSPDSICHLCGMRYSRTDGVRAADYDRDNFLSENSVNQREDAGVRWSSRTRLFDTRRLGRQK
jgi:MoaA/NifB/PqqE/SkfB family radical SAM enzyme